MTDDETLEEITTIFVKALIAHKMEDENSYVELAKRIANLIDLEIKWRLKYEKDQERMQFWGPLTN